jgi:signal transduction histidine kinase
LSSDLIYRVFFDHAGTLWVATSDGLNRFDPRTGKFTVFKVDWHSGLSQFYLSIAEDPTRNVLWLGSLHSGLHSLNLATGQLQMYRPNSANLHALTDDVVPAVHVSGSGVVWAGTQNGLNKFDPTSGTLTSYDHKDGLAGNVVSCIQEDEHGALWVSTNGGVSRFDPKTDGFTNYSAADGLPGNDLTGLGACFKSPNGEMFFGGYSGGVAFYPDRLVTTPYVPPVALTEFRLFGIPVEVGGRSPLTKTISHTTRLRLSHEQNTFSVGFSALSYRNPANNRYRYELEPLENTWHEVGSDERLATYTTLPPGVFTFRVQAAASRAAWSEPGVKLEIEILPPLWKTAWFEALCGALVLALVWGLHRYRLHQIAQQFSAHLETRVDERTRIARELHDTLLQSFQGVMFRFQAARNMLPRRPEEAIEALDGALERTEQAIAEGRDSIQGLRSSTVVTNELAQAVTALGNEMSRERATQDSARGSTHNSARFHVAVVGPPRDLHPILRDDVYAIAREAVRNAFRHAQASNIEAELTYNGSAFQLRIRDDGKGIDPEIAAEGRAGHYGVSGMRERAKRIGGKLEVWTGTGAGTEIELSIPGSIAYGTSPGRTVLGLFRKKAAHS